MIGWLYEIAYGQDVRVYDSNRMTTSIGGTREFTCLGWFFWNGRLEKHEEFCLFELRDLGLTIDEIRSLVFAMLKITYSNTR